MKCDLDRAERVKEQEKEIEQRQRRREENLRKRKEGRQGKKSGGKVDSTILSISSLTGLCAAKEQTGI